MRRFTLCDNLSTPAVAGGLGQEVTAQNTCQQKEEGHGNNSVHEKKGGKMLSLVSFKINKS